MDEDEICYSIVEYMSDHSGYRCGYCKSSNTNYSHGMWAHRMNVYTYYHLINRGWRRSGKYCYKPTMDKTCCPQYTIRCDINNFKISKSQKKVLKRMHTFLSTGIKKGDSNEVKDNPEEFVEAEQCGPRIPSTKDIAMNHKIPIKNLNKNVNNSEPLKESSRQVGANKISNSEQTNQSLEIADKTKFNTGMGPDPSKPFCKKAKIQRLERRAAKAQPTLNSQNNLMNTSSSKNSNNAKTLEDHLNSPLPEFPAHKLEVRLVLALEQDDEYLASLDQSYAIYKKYQMTTHKERETKCTKSRYQGFLCESTIKLRLVAVSSDDSEFVKTFETSYELFRKYQMKVHGDPPSECDESSYKNFLIDGPLRPYTCHDGPERGYGPFHQQYWLDGQLIAVGVLDILPCAVSSVYFYYDPKFSFLSLGTYSSLREIALTRSLSNTSSQEWYYYMGFYIHSCPKMRYKGQYLPSYLLCPETYQWVPIERCIPKLNVCKYSKLSDLKLREDLDINKIQCMYDGNRILYEKLRRNPLYDDDDEEVAEYLKLVGHQACSTTLLYRN